LEVEACLSALEKNVTLKMNQDLCSLSQKNRSQQLCLKCLI